MSCLDTCPYCLGSKQTAIGTPCLGCDGTGERCNMCAAPPSECECGRSKEYWAKVAASIRSPK